MKNCKQFCEKDFIVEREKVEDNYSKKSKIRYKNIKELSKTNKPLAKLLKKMYMNLCNDIYCQTKCTNKKKWLKSFTKKRREKLMNQGAISGCRDLMKEFPTYYKNL